MPRSQSANVALPALLEAWSRMIALSDSSCVHCELGHLVDAHVALAGRSYIGTLLRGFQDTVADDSGSHQRSTFLCPRRRNVQAHE